MMTFHEADLNARRGTKVLFANFFEVSPPASEETN